MTTRITTSDSYKAEFGKPEQRECALKYALDIRKFEIDLYWKRTNYFWSLLAATFAGYFLLAARETVAPVLVFLVSCIGLVLSTGWYLVNRGSKYWQSNWERHVDSLEDEFIGPLYKTTVSKETFPFWHFWDGYRYSVSKVNQLISLFITVIWFGLFVVSFPPCVLPACLTTVGAWILAGTTLVFLALLLLLGLSGPQGKPRAVDFRRSDLVSSEGENAG